MLGVPIAALGPWEAAAPSRVPAQLVSAWPQSQGIPLQGTRRDFVPEQKAYFRLGPAVSSSLLALGLWDAAVSFSLSLPSDSSCKEGFAAVVGWDGFSKCVGDAGTVSWGHPWLSHPSFKFFFLGLLTPGVTRQFVICTL